MPISADHFLYRSSKFPLRPEAFREFSATVRSDLGLPADILLEPGTDIGYQRLRYVHSPIADFEWVHIRTLIISERLRELFVAEGFTGWRAEPVEFVGVPPSASDGLFWELVVEGRGGPAITQPETRLLSVCPVCGREEYDRGMLRAEPLNIETWDGSDFFYFDAPEDGIFFVTERVKLLFERLGLKEAYYE
jgi:hypothetical protein